MPFLKTEMPSLLTPISMRVSGLSNVSSTVVGLMMLLAQWISIPYLSTLDTCSTRRRIATCKPNSLPPNLKNRRRGVCLFVAHIVCRNDTNADIDYINKTRTSKVGAISKAQKAQNIYFGKKTSEKCKRGDPLGFIIIYSVAKYQKT